jgi:transposase InsO family protein
VAAATALGLSARTLRAWQRRVAHRAVGRGRPPHRLTAAERTLMAAVWLGEGPGVSVAALQRGCPSVPRRRLGAWLRAVRRACRATLIAVTWPRAGRVWALDWAVPPHPIEGRYRALVQVRDLGSGYRLAVVPIRRPTARCLLAILRALGAQADVPLVLKLDNGGPCRSRGLRAWARGAGVALLYSPPYCPQYNGSIEASIGAIATRIHEAAAWAGHPEVWTVDDVARAWAQANVAAAPAGVPVARWHARRAITRRERQRFARTLATHLDALAHAASRAYSAATRQRLALVRTLQQLGYVRMTRSGDFRH